MYKNLARRALVATAAASVFPRVFSQTPAQSVASAGMLKVGFVHVAPVGDAGWVKQHDDGQIGRAHV